MSLWIDHFQSLQITHGPSLPASRPILRRQTLRSFAGLTHLLSFQQQHQRLTVSIRDTTLWRIQSVAGSSATSVITVHCRSAVNPLISKQFAMHKPHLQIDKALLALERESNKLTDSKLCKAPLDPPIRRGWKRCYFLTPSASQRPEAKVLEVILSKINVTRTHCRRDFSPTKRNRRRQIHDLEQPLPLLKEYQFGDKSSQIPKELRSWFVPMPVFENQTMQWKLAFSQPQLFELRIVTNIQTEGLINDANADSRLTEIESQLYPRGWARLSKLHGFRKHRSNNDTAKKEAAEWNAKQRIRAAYLGEYEAEKSNCNLLDVLIRFVSL
jgi:hypothetical protein